MHLAEIEGLFNMDTGAPSPLIISSDNELALCFYALKDDGVGELTERNTVYDTGVVVIQFKGCIYHHFGLPGDETLPGHPYYNLGLGYYGFYEVFDSDLIDRLKKIQKVHPYYKEERWQPYRHFILTFHDNTFECICKEFDVAEEKTSIFQQAHLLLNSMAARSL